MLNNFSVKWDKFVINFIDKGGYKQVIDGLGNTVEVAILGLVIGMLCLGIIALILNR